METKWTPERIQEAASRVYSMTDAQQREATAKFHDKAARAFRSLGEVEQAERAQRLAAKVRAGKED